LSERYQMPILVVHTPFSQRVPGWRAPQRELAHIHLSNFDGREHRLPQCGQLDLRVFLRQLAMDNFGGTISLELHPDALAFQDAEACSRLLKESVDFCRTHLGST
jgi:sugar phosphate isomerase/epimerase